MATPNFCDPCTEEGKNSKAIKYCTDCEEKFCGECLGSHLRFKKFKSHHVIDLSSIGSRIPTSSKINCEIHTDIQIDYFCSQHDSTHHFFRNACTKSGSLRFSQFSGC